MYAHLDIRNFFATCEQYLNPEYRGKPLVIYNESESGTKKIIAVSKEAKERYKISRSSYMNDVKRIPDAILIKSNRNEYEKISDKLYEKCKGFVEGEGCSISKPYIDDMVMKLPEDLGVAIKLTRRIEDLYKESGFDLAIGISFNEDYARIAGKKSKKYGLIYFGRGLARKWIYKLPVIEFPGIGPKREEKLNRANIQTIGDIAESPLDLIIAILGNKTGRKIYCSVLDAEPDKKKIQPELFETGN